MSDVMSSPQKRILVITAHPGDADMMAGGSVAPPRSSAYHA
jgi:LmbE family N-acetylglucosaminyl deacetylase